MSHSRKHVTEKVLNDFPVPVEPQFIGRCVALKGNNIVQVENNKGEQFSAMIPQKFHKLVWITRGAFVIVEPFGELKTESGSQVFVVAVLYKEQVKYLKGQNKWPVEFADEEGQAGVKPNKDRKATDLLGDLSDSAGSESGSEDSLDGVSNPNQRAQQNSDEGSGDDYSI